MGEKGGGIGGPGQRVVTYDSAREQIRRVLLTVMWMCVFAVVIVGLTVVDGLLWGPWVGVVLGWAALLGVWYWKVLPWAAREGKREWSGSGHMGEVGAGHWAALGALLAALVAWGFGGYEVLDAVWPPWRIPLPLWAKLPIEAVTLSVRAAAVWGIWGMWVELVDPFGPTAPRAAVDRQTVIRPWDKEPAREAGEQDAGGAGDGPAVYLPLIIQERRNGHSLREDRVLMRAPSLREDGLYQYAQALAAGRAYPSWEGGRTGAGARQYGYSEAEFEEWRAAAVRVGLLARRPGRNQGFEVTERGQFQFGRIGEKRLQAAAFTEQG